MAKNLKSVDVLQFVVGDEPLIDRLSPDLSPVLSAVIVNVIYSKELFRFFSATGTLIPEQFKNLRAILS